MPSHFTPMIDENRYDTRSNDFDKIISQTHKHFWDPNDTKYIDYNVDFDMEKYYTESKVLCLLVPVYVIY